MLQLLGTPSPRPPVGASPLDPNGGLPSPDPLIRAQLQFLDPLLKYTDDQLDIMKHRQYSTVDINFYTSISTSAISMVSCTGKLYGNYLITTYLAVKLLYLANAVGQLFMLDAFLKIDYHLYGVQVVERLIRGQDWGYSERFPRVTLCEFEIRHQSRVHQYVVQCALTINLWPRRMQPLAYSHS